MRKTFFLGCLSLSVLGLSSSAFAQTQTQVHTSPFTDHLAVNLHDFPNDTKVTLTYASNNDVNISGPSFLDVSGFTVFPVQISSHNYFERGYPAMTILLPKLGSFCRLQFVDGPYTYLNFVSGPPTCNHLTVSNISYDAKYTYHVDLSYH